MHEIPDFSQSAEKKEMNSEFKDFEKKEIDLITNLEKRRNKDNTKINGNLINGCPNLSKILL